MPNPVIIAGIPAINRTFYREIRFSVGDPAALIMIPRTSGGLERVLILRDIEADRARRHARADRIAVPSDFTPSGGLSGDRETATAQAAAECLRRAGVREVVADRTLPLIFAHYIERAGIAVACDPELGVLERRAKDAQEVQWLREAQGITEGAMRMACELVARARPDADGVLQHDGAPLTAERLRAMIAIWLLERGFAGDPAIVASGAEGGDCHNLGKGPIRTGEPVIIDIFPRSAATLYCGDCTRTVVHGQVPPEVARMHAAVVDAKRAAIAAVRPGVTGHDIHAATVAALKRHGYSAGFPPADRPDEVRMTHGTGHGIGLDVHEPPLLAENGPALVVGDALTIEPGLYGRSLGGVRVEDLVIVTRDGCDNLNTLPEGLTWR